MPVKTFIYKPKNVLLNIYHLFMYFLIESLLYLLFLWVVRTKPRIARVPQKYDTWQKFPSVVYSSLTKIDELLRSFLFFLYTYLLRYYMIFLWRDTNNKVFAPF